MDDVAFLAVAENVVRHVGENYGRVAAWLTAVIMVVLPIAMLVVVGSWLLSG